MQDQEKADGEHNPFTDMGMIKFWAMSTVVYLIFSVSLIESYIIFEPLSTKQLVTALTQDFLQMLLVVIRVLIVLISAVFHYLGPLVVGWLGG